MIDDFLLRYDVHEVHTTVSGPAATVVEYGVVGRFWQTSGGLRRVDPAVFRDFAEPGYAKAAFNFRLEPRGGRTLLWTETRVLATDERARRRFRRYWRLIHPGSAAIRVAWLRAIRKRGERTERAERTDYSSRPRRAASAATRQSPQTSDKAARRLDRSASRPISGGPARKPT
jgi:hypothetical protein